MNNHTPCPWEMGETDAYHRPCIKIGKQEKWEATLSVAPVLESRANARLIAAAPEMFEALIAVDKVLNEHFGITSEDIPGNSIHDQVRSAIAKAKGE